MGCGGEVRGGSSQRPASVCGELLIFATKQQFATHTSDDLEDLLRDAMQAQESGRRMSPAVTFPVP